MLQLKQFSVDIYAFGKGYIGLGHDGIDSELTGLMFVFEGFV